VERKDIQVVSSSPRGRNHVRKNIEQKTRWIHYQNVSHRGWGGRWISHSGIWKNVLCYWSICQTDKKCSGSPLHDNRTYFKVPKVVFESIRSKLVFQTFDEYFLKVLYRTKFNGCPKDNDTHDQMDTVPNGPIPPLITSLQTWQTNNIRRQKEKEKKGVG
jgi:hypothetical protein